MNAFVSGPGEGEILARFSVATNDKDPLSKTMSLDPATGEVVKGQACKMQSGWLHQRIVRSLQQFADGLRRLTPDKALVHGIADFEKCSVVTAGKLERVRAKQSAGAPPVIARTTDFINYPDGPGLMMFDHDKPRSNSFAENTAALSVLKPCELISTISEIMPEISDAGWVSTPSTSSCIFDKNGVELRGESSGFHLYCFVENGRDIPRFLDVLGKRLFLAGLGRVELSRSSVLLFRTLIDLLVGSPERLDFAAGAVCEGGLVQRLPPPHVKEGCRLNTTLLPDLTADEEQAYFAARGRLTELAKPGQAIVKDKYTCEESTKLSAERSISIDEARQIILSRQDRILADGDLLFFSHLRGAAVTVGEVLDNSADFHKRSLADPAEREYEGGSLTKAKFYWNDGNPKIQSFAHGGILYRFARFEKNAVEPDTEEKPWFGAALENSSVSRFIDLEPPALEWVFKGTLLARTTGMIVGPGAAGKSTMALLMLVASGTGRDILPGIFTPTKAGKVLGVFAEDDEGIIHHRMHNIVEHLFKNDPEAKELLRQNMKIVSTTGHDVRFFNQSSGDLQESKFFNEVFDAINGVEGWRLIILDPVSRYHGGEENDNGAGTFLVTLLERIAQQTSAAVIILHHVGKRAGSDVHGFDLDAAMHQDAARGASGLTNGVRWQCNLFGLPEKNAKKILGVKSSDPGQYLALKVCKKNYGPPEPVFFLERLRGGMLVPCEINTHAVDADLEALVKGLLLDAVMKSEGQFVTKRILLDGSCSQWKEIDSRISRRVVDQTVAACILNRELFERIGKRPSGKQVSYLSNYPEPDVKTDPESHPEGCLDPEGHPEGHPESYDLEGPEGSGKNDLPDHIKPDSLDILNPEGLIRKNDVLRIANHRYYGSFNPEIIPPYGGAMPPSGLAGADAPKHFVEEENAEYF